jgi:hypothetical protein
MPAVRDWAGTGVPTFLEVKWTPLSRQWQGQI